MAGAIESAEEALEELTDTAADLVLVDTSLPDVDGIGLGVVRVSSSVDVGDADFGGDDTEAGVNIVGGAEFDVGFLTPFVQAQFTNGGNIDRFGITGGLLLPF